MTEPLELSRRERQIMDVLIARGEAAAADVQGALPGAPSYSTVRALLRRLVDKGHVRYRQEGTRYLYRPTLEAGRARRSALNRLVQTFFGGSARDAMVNLLGAEGGELSDADLEAIEQSLRELKRAKRRRSDGPRKR
jgi:BlaI family transcriptional regulator, penicillinase repressor